ncbi:MAG: hypothetical protein UX45_C0041G0001 [Candidatus Uhrbacteria bacterium GW2011_GWF2_46_218]|uniref:Peptidase S74 domain-containing protein n=1 Tax=Candidatus Uhrbacteria bacterium GW2011_GWF2_46_218 TaxID=1619001 RepID=A0A0G1PCZ8_9BACT|nr:MAG: hypothetical protein UX45_C0041G0001 [Candidatus Uhrbacteria bacterium GW2011_GWF2_46_218]
MANSILSELTEVTSLAATDLLYLVRGTGTGCDKKIQLSNFGGAMGFFGSAYTLANIGGTVNVHVPSASDPTINFANTATGYGAHGLLIGIDKTTGVAYINQQENLSLLIKTNNTTRITITAAGVVEVGSSLTCVGNITVNTNKFFVNATYGNIGIGAIPNADSDDQGYNIARIGASGSLYATTSGESMILASNSRYVGSATFKRDVSGYASYYQQINGTHLFGVSEATAAADSAITWSTVMDIHRGATHGVTITGNLNTSDGIISTVPDTDAWRAFVGTTSGALTTTNRVLMNLNHSTSDTMADGFGTAIDLQVNAGTISRISAKRNGADNTGTLNLGVADAGAMYDVVTITYAKTVVVSAAVQFSGYGAGTATFDASGNITSVSDMNKKNYISDFTGGLESIMGIKPINYMWKPETGLDTVNVYTGFSAQNVKEFIPEAVFGTEGNYSLSDRPIIAALVNGMKEQQLVIENQTKRIEQLEALLS